MVKPVKNTDFMLERPESSKIVASITYGILAFFSLPFILLLLLQGSFDNEEVVVGVEMAYHVINFLATLCIFHAFLKESFWNVESNVKHFAKTVAMSAGVTIVVAIIVFWFLLPSDNPYAIWGAYGILPLAEMNLFALPSDLIYVQPIWGVLCTTLLAPITIGCVYYATVFAPIANDHPKLAYVVMAVCLAIPRLCNALTYWDPMGELVMYVVQLPIHMVACRAYQKTDTVWAPIGVLAAVNLVTGCAFALMRVLM